MERAYSIVSNEFPHQHGFEVKNGLAILSAGNLEISISGSTAVVDLSQTSAFYFTVSFKFLVVVVFGTVVLSFLILSCLVAELYALPVNGSPSLIPLLFVFNHGLSACMVYCKL